MNNVDDIVSLIGNKMDINDLANWEIYRVLPFLSPVSV